MRLEQDAMRCSSEERLIAAENAMAARFERLMEEAWRKLPSTAAQTPMRGSAADDGSIKPDVFAMDVDDSEVEVVVLESTSNPPLKAPVATATTTASPRLRLVRCCRSQIPS